MGLGDAAIMLHMLCSFEEKMISGSD